MIGWNSNFNWTHEEFNNVIHQAFDVENKHSICLDVEHSDWRNMEDIKHWAEEKGYKAIEVNCDTIRVVK